MATQPTRQIAAAAGLPEPLKVIGHGGGKPAAILKNSRPVDRIVPVEAVRAPGTHRAAMLDELRARPDETRAEVKPAPDDLRDQQGADKFSLTAGLVVEIRDEAPNPGEMPRLARDRSPEGALARPGNRLALGLIEDRFTWPRRPAWSSPPAMASTTSTSARPFAR